MSQDDYFRKQAEDAQKHADETKNDADRISWRRLAKSWFGLIRWPSPEEKEKARSDGTDKDRGVAIDFEVRPKTLDKER